MISRRLVAAAAALASLAVPAAASAAEFFDVEKLPPPPVEGKEIAANTESFSEEFAHRVGGTPIATAAAEFLQADAESLGYDVELRRIPVAEGDPGTIGEIVIATRPGVTKPDEHLLFMGHFDVVPQTINGAYDNGSGTSMIRALAKSLKDVPTNRTISFIWYSTEEEGLLASEAHAAEQAEAGLAVRAVLGFDMVGIAWPTATMDPGTNCLCFWHGEDDEDLEGLLNHVHFNVLGFPAEDGKVQFQGVNSRNSDERSWDIQGYRVLRWAGMPTASTYPAYHMPDDTMATMEEQAGGREFLEMGMRNTLVASYTTALALDNEPPVAKGTATGGGPTVSFDAGGSTDPDGPLSRFAWDFGDGSSAVGSSVEHTYRKKGVYTARLTVGDNLWPQVSRTVEVPVTVTKGAAKPRKRCGRKPSKRASAKRKKAHRRCVAKRKRARRGR